MALNYELRRDAHAIGEFTAILQFVGAIGMGAYAQVTPILKALATELDLPAPVNVQVFNFAIGGQAGMQPPPFTPMGGTGFQRFASNGEVACSLVCNPDSIAFTLREYTRWHEVLPLIVNTFGRLGQAYLTEMPAIRSFSVQYVNEFRAKTADVWCTGELFNKASKWIAPFSYESQEAWHCHVGQFIPATDEYRYLVNVNCDISPSALPGDETQKNYARVLILSALHYDMPDRGPLVAAAGDLASLIERHFNDAHSMEKKILNDVLSDEYIAVMGEGANDY